MQLEQYLDATTYGSNSIISDGSIIHFSVHHPSIEADELDEGKISAATRKQDK